MSETKLQYPDAGDSKITYIAIMNNYQMLMYAVEHDIVCLADIENLMKKDERKRCLDCHPYKIYQGSDGGWYTYLVEDTAPNHRRRIKRHTKEDIEDAIISHQKELEDNPTIEEVFTEWNDRRKNIGKIKDATAVRIKTTFKKYFKGIKNERIKTITQADISDFLEEQLGMYEMSTTEFNNLKSVVRGMLRRAKKRGYISYPIEPIFQELDVSDHDFKRTVHNDEEEIFYDDEIETIMDYCINHNDEVDVLGIALLFVSGVRIGELVALKYEDIGDDYILVSKTETIHEVDGKLYYEIDDNPKTSAGIRKVIIPKDYFWILSDLKRLGTPGKYIFSKNGERLYTYQLRYVLKKMCKKNSMDVRTPHKVRKTYGSILLDNSINSKLIEKQMGHTEITCTERYYHRDRMRDQKKHNIIDNIPEFCGPM